MRPALARIRELLDEASLVVAILPTGYGKSSFFMYNPDLLDEWGRVVHLLPLRAIVRELGEKLKKKFGERVGYQAGIQVEDVDKTPFFTTEYTVATLDSFFFNFYGIPVLELYRPKWHSDVALTIARCSHVLLDEIHLVVTPDRLHGEMLGEEYAKVLLVIRDLVKWNHRMGLKTLMLTATLYPWLLKHMVPDTLPREGVRILVYAPPDHPYVHALEREWNVEYCWPREDDFQREFRDYCDHVSTIMHMMTMPEVLENIFKRIISTERRLRRVAVMFNSVRRCVNAFEKYSRYLSRCGLEAVMLHGRMTNYARERALKSLSRDSEESPKVLFATQVVEAGVDISFDIVVTEVAPPHALIQRAGRLARYGVRSAEKSPVQYEFHIVIGNNDIEKGVKELCQGIYDASQVFDTVMRMLNEAEEVENSAGRVRINWRLPVEGNGLDYLKLLCVAEEPKGPLNASSGIGWMLRKLTYRRAETNVLRQLDEKLRGSFIRTAALLSLYVGLVDCPVRRCEISAYIKQYTIPISTHFLIVHGKDVLDVKSGYAKLAFWASEPGAIQVGQGPRLSYLCRYPLTSIKKAVNRLRKQCRGSMVLLGLLAKEELRRAFKIERGYLK